MNYNSILGRSASHHHARYELVSPFITDISLRYIIGQPPNTIDLRKVMDEGKTLFVNLSQGDLGEANSSPPRASASARCTGWW